MQQLTRKLIFGMLLSGSACSNNSATSDLAIVRGKPVPSTSPAYWNTVRITSGFSSCTASIIQEKLILTAAHCVEDATADTIKVIFKRADANPVVDKVIAVSRVQMFKSEGAQFFPNFDIAWLELKEPVPAPFKPMEILRDPALVDASTPVLLAGYGMQADDCAGCSGVLMEGPTEYSAYYDKAHLLSLMVFYGDPRKNLSGACYGDSGGPAYVKVNGSWFLAGVTNGFTTAVTPLTDGTCASGWDIYTFAGDYLPWLEQSSGIAVPHDQLSINPDRAQNALVMQGPAQKVRPTNWTEWVNFANHEDPAWYTVDALLGTLSGEYEGLGLPVARRTEILYEPALTVDTVARKEKLTLGGPGTGDLSPLASFVGLKQLTLASRALADIEALDGLPVLNELTLDRTEFIGREIWSQIPQLKQRLKTLTFAGVKEDVLKDVSWDQLAGLQGLVLENSSLDLSLLDSVRPKNLALWDMTIRGKVPGDTLQSLSLRRVIDTEKRGPLGYVEATSSITQLTMNRLTADALNRLPEFLNLRALGLEDMKLNLSQAENLALPVPLQTLSVSGNRLTALPQTASWKGLRSIAAYDNPFEDWTCPAASCSFDRNPQPKTLQAYCENVSSLPSYSYAYTPVIMAILRYGKDIENPPLVCDGIETKAGEVKDLWFFQTKLDDIRPVALLKDSLQSLNIGFTQVEDLTPLAHMNRMNDLSIHGLKNVDLAILKDNLGLNIYGITVDHDPINTPCPIVAGSCNFIWGDKYQNSYGPLLGTHGFTGFAPSYQLSLVGIDKTFKPEYRSR